MKKFGIKAFAINGKNDFNNLKKDFLYFDSIYSFINPLHGIHFPVEFQTSESGRLLQKLVSKELLIMIPDGYSYSKHMASKNSKEKFENRWFESQNLVNLYRTDFELLKIAKILRNRLFKHEIKAYGSDWKEDIYHHTVARYDQMILELDAEAYSLYNNFSALAVARYLQNNYQKSAIPIMSNDINIPFSNDILDQPVLEIVSKQLPIIHDSVPWEQIIEYKSDEEARRKFLALRNWMIDISKGDYTISEIEEKFEHLLHEYRAAINRHKMKVNQGTFKTFIISTAEILEDLAKLKFGKVAKAGFEIIERKEKLLDLHTNIPGKEVAYIYDVNEKFGKGG